MQGLGLYGFTIRSAKETTWIETHLPKESHNIRNLKRLKILEQRLIQTCTNKHVRTMALGLGLWF